MSNIDSKQLKKMLENNEVILIDVRESIEYEAEHIEGAVLIPLGELDKSKLPNINSKKIVLYCKSGKRGSSAYQKIKAFESNHDCYNLNGGISEWKLEGYSVIKAKGTFLSLERQVHAIVGTSVLVSSLLAHCVNINFAFVSAFFGLGLAFAGFTGFCGLALLLAKAPWNKKYRINFSCKLSCQ